MTAISIEVDNEVARTFFDASAEEKRKLQLLVNLRLKELLLSPNKALTDVMDEIGNYAETQGMTAELLKSLLNE